MERLERVLDRFVSLGGAAFWLLGGALVAYFALVRSSADPDGVALAALFVLVVLAGTALGASSPLHGWGIRLLFAVVPLAGFTAWVYASSGWSGSPGRAAIEADRALLYLVVVLAFGALGWSHARARALVGGVLAAIAVACGLGVASRLLPGLVDVDPGPTPERLCYPITYWNAMGLLAGLGVILAVHVSSSLKEGRVARCLAAAVVPLAASALLLTLSRGALWTTAAGMVVYLLFGRPRGALTAAFAIVPTTAIALLALDHGDVVGVTPEAIARFDLASQPASVLGFAMVAAVVLRALVLPLDRRIGAIEVSDGARRFVLGAGAVGVVVAVALGALAAQSVGVGDQAYDRFVAGVGTESTADRLTSVSSNNRLTKWRAAMDEYRADPAHGSGAGTYQLAWLEHRKTDGKVLDAHSLYIEVLGELGWPGLVALVAALLALLGGLALRARGPDRGPAAALLACGVAWAASAGFDWHWEMPAVSLLLFAAGGLALSRRADAPARPTGPRGAAVRVAVVALCGGLAVLPVRVGLAEIRFQDSVTALYQDDCLTAKRDARSSVSAFDGSWAPWQVLGYCALRERKWDEAERALRAASDRDPRNWMPLYALAVAQAAGGEDPRATLEEARTHNPRSNQLSIQPGESRRELRQRLRRAARKAAVPLPTVTG